ncbi:hypothetical protein PYW07_005138 [Mythimna separata]|uniref:Peritrophin type-A domain protein 2 n=1 Tax=Mythimna separata TaxID=271217 RepID=A0AAD8DNR8_MYTSE|nr:hypothetical protein PYW07_005138 [Mythimna separata]
MSAKIVLVLCALIAWVSSVPAQPGAGIGAWGGGGGGWGGAAGWGGAGAGAWGGIGAGAGAGANPWIPPWVSAAPWYPQWVPCTVIGSTCVDCNTKVVCTKVGGLQRACTDPTLPYCNAGACSATPSAECAAPAVNANDAVAPRTVATV